MDRSEPCAKCRTLIYASAFHTCPKESCYYHLPYRPAPPPPAEQASGEIPPPEDWREAFIHVSKMRYMDAGMKVEQAQILADVDAQTAEAIWRGKNPSALSRQSGGLSDSNTVRPVVDEGAIAVVASDLRHSAAYDDLKDWQITFMESLADRLTAALAPQQQGGNGDA